MRALIADDNREIRAALRLVLEELGAAQPGLIVEAHDAAEALTCLEKADFDLLLLDWDLPGSAAARVLGRANRRLPACTVIAISGRPEARADSLRRGATHFVSTSDAPGRLLELLRTL